MYVFVLGKAGQGEKFNSSLEKLKTFEAFFRTYPCSQNEPLVIDGTKYNDGKTISITGLRVYSPDNVRRSMIIGFVSTTQNESVYAQYLTSNKIIAMKTAYDVGGYASEWKTL